MNKRFTRKQRILLGLGLILVFIVCSYFITPLIELSHAKTYTTNDLINNIYLNETYYFAFENDSSGTFKKDNEGKISSQSFTFTMNKDGVIAVSLHSGDSLNMIFYKQDVIFNLTYKAFIYRYTEQTNENK